MKLKPPEKQALRLKKESKNKRINALQHIIMIIMIIMTIMTIMTNQNIRLRTVLLNDRGQIVIPEDIRRDLGLKANQVMVLIERAGELLLKREKDVASLLLDNEERFWKQLSLKSLENVWSKEDEAWDSVEK